MFNPQRLWDFIKRLARLLVSAAVGLLVLSLFTEVVTHREEMPSALLGWQFWTAVVGNLTCAIVAFGLIFWLAGRFVRDLYQLEDTRAGIDFLLRSRFGLSSFGPWMKVDKGTITKYKDGPLSRTGGPGHLVLYRDSAVVLEQAGRLKRVVGSGFPKLEAFEMLYDVVDLRPKRWVFPVRAMTRDGIFITWDAEIHYQIADDNQAPSEQDPYPLSEEAVFRAATSRWVFVDGPFPMDWEARIIISNTEGSLRTILARKQLNQLIGLTEQDARAARREVQRELETELRQSAPSVGAKILDVKLDNLQVEDEITQQWIEAWRARWQSWSTERLAHGEAAQIYLRETAKAEAQMSLLTSIGRALKDVADKDVVIPRIVLNRLLSALDGASFSATSRIFFPGKALEALDRMRTIVEGEYVPMAQLPAGDTGDEEGP